MHVPSPETRNVGHSPYPVPTQARTATVVDRPVPASIANAHMARTATTVAPMSYAVGRFQVANVTVRQAEPRDAIPAPDTRSIS